MINLYSPKSGDISRDFFPFFNIFDVADVRYLGSFFRVFPMSNVTLLLFSRIDFHKSFKNIYEM